MIKLTSMDNRTIVVNINLIEKIESMPETVISLTTGKKIIVLEGVDEVIGRAIEYQSMVMKNSLTPAHRGELYE
ncbi:MAG: flagellar FlbD family protein [Bacillota bacterium]